MSRVMSQTVWRYRAKKPGILALSCHRNAQSQTIQYPSFGQGIKTPDDIVKADLQSAER